MTKVKICGITNLEDALLSVKFGADALGFNFYKKSPRFTEAEKVREIVEQLKGEVLKVGVFVNESLENVAEIAATAKLDAIQLHGEETPEFCREVKEKTNLEIIKAFRVSPDFTPEDVLKYEVDAILLDAYNPKEHGGTGETFDWEIAKKVQEIFPKMYLAGGLNRDNIADAILRVEPFAVDVCSGIESEKGNKDKFLLINFLKASKHHQNVPVKDDDIWGLLSIIQARPTLYLGKDSLFCLMAYLTGFDIGLKYGSNFFDWKTFDEFVSFIGKKLSGGSTNTYDWLEMTIKKFEGDEKKALNFFFALLEEFKLEKEDLLGK
jgi:phosphoribosylanthranilate isomerase